MYLRVPEKAVLERIWPTFEKSKAGHFFVFLCTYGEFVGTFFCDKIVGKFEKIKNLWNRLFIRFFQGFCLWSWWRDLSMWRSHISRVSMLIDGYREPKRGESPKTKKKSKLAFRVKYWSWWRDLKPWPLPYQGGALPFLF